MTKNRVWKNSATRLPRMLLRLQEMLVSHQPHFAASPVPWRTHCCKYGHQKRSWKHYQVTISTVLKNKGKGSKNTLRGKNIKERAGIQRGCTRICSSHQKRWKWTIRSDVSSWYKGVTSHQKETEKRGLNNYFCHYTGQSPRLSELQSRCHLKTPCSLKSEGMCEASMACENQCN